MTFKTQDKVGIPGSDRIYTVVAVLTTLLQIERENGHRQYVPASTVKLIGKEVNTK